MSAWRLVPLGLTAFIVAWVVASGSFSIDTGAVTTQGNVLVPIPPPKVVEGQWTPMLTFGQLRAIAEGAVAPTFKPSDLRHWEMLSENGDMCDAPLVVALCDALSEATVRDEFRLGFPSPWLSISANQGAHSFLAPLVRRESSPVASWRLLSSPWWWTLVVLERADGRFVTISVFWIALLVPLSIATGFAAALPVASRRFRLSPRTIRCMRYFLLAFFLAAYVLPVWAPDRLHVFRPLGATAQTTLTLSQVFSLSDSVEDTRRCAAAMVAAFEKAAQLGSSQPCPRDEDLVAFGYAAASPPFPQANRSTLAIGRAFVVIHWEMPNVRAEAIGSFWHLGESWRLMRRVQTSSRVTLTVISINWVLKLMALVFAPVYLTWIAQRLWLRRLVRRRREAKQCAACGYQICRPSEE